MELIDFIFEFVALSMENNMNAENSRPYRGTCPVFARWSGHIGILFIRGCKGWACCMRDSGCAAGARGCARILARHRGHMSSLRGAEWAHGCYVRPRSRRPGMSPGGECAEMPNAGPDVKSGPAFGSFGRRVVQVRQEARCRRRGSRSG